MYIIHLWYFSMSQGLSDRAMLLLEMASIKTLEHMGDTPYVRWQNIKRGKARIGADEIEALGKMFENYRWWLMTGEVMPEKGQTSPEYDEAHSNLSNQNAG